MYHTWLLGNVNQQYGSLAMKSVWITFKDPKADKQRGGMELGMGGRFKREGPYVYLWLIHVDVWQKPTQYCKAVVLSHFSCFRPCNPMDCRLPGSSVHGILQARILEWVAISFSRGPSWPRDRTQVFCIAGRFFTLWPTREANYKPIIFQLKINKF